MLPAATVTVGDAEPAAAPAPGEGLAADDDTAEVGDDPPGVAEEVAGAAAVDAADGDPEVAAAAPPFAM